MTSIGTFASEQDSGNEKRNIFFFFLVFFVQPKIIEINYLLPDELSASQTKTKQMFFSYKLFY
jgi:hypothetical protein